MNSNNVIITHLLISQTDALESKAFMETFRQLMRLSKVKISPQWRNWQSLRSRH